MYSIPTIFIWDKVTKQVVNKPLRMVDWVFTGKGTPTRKYDGIAILIENGKVFRRYEWRKGQIAPSGFVRLQDFDPKRPDAVIPGWVPVGDSFLSSPKGPDERALKQAWNDKIKDIEMIAFNNRKAQKVVNKWAPEPKELDLTIPDGTYELCGPDIRHNHEQLFKHVLLKHGEEEVKKVPRTYEGLKKWLETYEGEGIVWHYKTGAITQMAKIKRRDFGFVKRLDSDYYEEQRKKILEEVTKACVPVEMEVGLESPSL